jgi:lipoteichoic acid synthase
MTPTPLASHRASPPAGPRWALGLSSWTLRVPMTADDWREALAVLGAVAIALLSSRLYKVLVTLRLEDEVDGIALGKRLVQGALVVLGLTASAFAARLAARRGLRPRTLVIAAFGAAVLFVGVVAARAVLHGGAHGLRKAVLVQRLLLFFEVFRGDIAFLVGFAVFVAVVLSVARGRARRFGVLGLRAAALLVIALTGFEAAYFRSTGLLGDGYILKYWVSNFGNVAFLVKNEMDLGNFALLVLSFALLPICLGAERLPRVRSWTEALPPRAPSLWMLVAAAAVLAALPPNAAVPFMYARVSRQFHAGAVIDLVRDPYWAVAAAGALNTKDEPPLARTHDLTFARTPRTKPLNVVFFILESTRARSVTPYNPGLDSTPFLAELARKSLLVDSMYAVIPHTARAWTAILTGLYPVTSSVAAWSDADAAGARLASLPRLLAPHGYRSAFFTPAHLKFEKDASLIKNRGFDVVHSDGDYDGTGFERTSYFGYEDRIMTKPSLAWVDQARADGRPFFLTFMTLSSHHDYKVPKAFPVVSYPGVHDKALNDYLNTLRYTDGWLREMFHAFEERGLMDSTVFVILGDHGESFGEHVARQHVGVLYEEALQIPTLIYAPSLWTNGRRIAGLRQQIDLLPTVADLLGFDLKGGFVPGVSLLADVPTDRTLYFTGSQENLYMALRRGPMKYVYFFRRSPLQAFNLDTDPGERDDLAAGLPPGEGDRIERELFRWRQRAIDVFFDAGGGR